MDSSSWTLGIVIFGVRFIAMEATFERSSRLKDAVRYRPVLGLRLCYGLGLPISLMGAFQIARQNNLKEDWRFLIIFLAMALGTLVSWQHTILITRTGVTESRWFGIKPVTITWPELEYATREPDRNTKIVAKDGRSITHSKYHVDPVGFVDELRKHCSVFGVCLIWPSGKTRIRQVARATLGASRSDMHVRPHGATSTPTADSPTPQSRRYV